MRLWICGTGVRRQLLSHAVCGMSTYKSVASTPFDQGISLGKVAKSLAVENVELVESDVMPRYLGTQELSCEGHEAGSEGTLEGRRELR